MASLNDANTYMTHHAIYPIKKERLNDAIKEIAQTVIDIRHSHKFGLANAIQSELEKGIIRISGMSKQDDYMDLQYVVDMVINGKNTGLIVYETKNSLVPLNHFHEIGQKYTN